MKFLHCVHTTDYNYSFSVLLQDTSKNSSHVKLVTNHFMTAKNIKNTLKMLTTLRAIQRKMKKNCFVINVAEILSPELDGLPITSSSIQKF